MLPRLSQMDSGDQTLAYTKALGDVPLPFFEGAAASDLQHGGFRKAAVEVIFSFGGVCVCSFPPKKAEGVTAILAGGNDLKIGDAIVVFDPVQVIDVHILGNGTDEGFRNEAVHFEGADFGRPGVNGYDSIAVFVSAARDHLATSSENATEARHAISGCACVSPSLHPPSSYYIPAVLH